MSVSSLNETECLRNVDLLPKSDTIQIKSTRVCCCHFQKLIYQALRPEVPTKQDLECGVGREKMLLKLLPVDRQGSPSPLVGRPFSERVQATATSRQPSRNRPRKATATAMKARAVP